MIRHELSESELLFNPADGQLIESVLAITDKLFNSLMSWLNNSSLPDTVLSCRYVQAMLTNYTRSVERLIDVCNLNDPRIPVDSNEDSEKYELVHRGLCSFILGLSKFIGYVLTVGTSVLYEEEDLTTRSMDLDFLSQIETKLIIQDIQHTIEWLNSKQQEKQGEEKLKFEELINRLEVVLRMNKIEALLTFSFEITDNFSKASPHIPKISFLNEVLDLLENKIKSLSNYISYVPDGSFSRFVQMDMNNRSIPAQLYELDPKESYTKLVEMFKQLNEIIVNSTQIYNHFKLENFLEYEVLHKISPNFNVFVRGLYQLFLVRDDKTILGSKRGNNTMAITIRGLEKLNCIDTQILEDDSTRLWGGDLKESVANDIFERLQQLLSDIERVVYHTLSNVTNNRCRQRQLMSRGLVIWDSLQVSLESFELEVWEKYKIGDEIENMNNELSPSLPISSYIYFEKLSLMIEILFRGFELDLYKDFEIPQIYWYISYLSQLIIEHLQGRIRVQLELKVKQINIGLSKKIKKLKAGDKKEKLKQLQQFKQANVIPIINLSINFNEKFRSKLFQAYLKLSDSIKLIFIILNSLKVFDIFKGPTLNLSNLENIYNLRMKPFSSIGVPSLPQFQQYKFAMNLNGTIGRSVSIQDIQKSCLQELNECKEDLLAIKQFMATEDFNVYSIERCDGVNEWIEGLLKTSIHYSIEVEKLETIINDPKLVQEKNYKVEIGVGMHIYFPKIEITANDQLTITPVHRIK